MAEVYIVEAARSPLGKRRGGLSTLHAVDLLAKIQKGAIDRSGVDAKAVGSVIGGCVSQVGEQAYNVTRTAWLTAGLPIEVPGMTVDSQCGSSQQASTLATGLVASGLEDLVLACGVETMSRLPLGANFGDKKLGRPLPPSYFARFAFASQFEGAEMIAKEYGITRAQCDAFGLRSQQRAAAAWAAGHFTREVVPFEAPVVDAEGKPTGETLRVARDEGLRETSLEKLATLDAVVEGGVHTAGSSSQITDGSAAVLFASEAALKAHNLKPRARVVYTTLVGVDPVTMLKGPIPATRKVLAKTGLGIRDIDVFEINEAFASVVLAWQKELNPPEERVNPNGGAIALGHPTGATGARLITTALHELERTGARRALITMCCGGGLGTGTLIERV
jgi:acetyl-CoA C-acetyltransferase